jgi:type II secretory pathway pseudopilin PulG
VRSLSAIETMAVVAVAGSVLAATVPAFVRNLRASRLSEPVEALHQIALHATLYAVGHPTSMAYPASVGQTPARVPAGQRVTDPPGTWDHPTWRRLDFRMLEPHGFAYEFESQNAASAASFSVRAHGDLDGDGVTSTFEMTGDSRESEEPRIGELRVYREVE